MRGKVSGSSAASETSFYNATQWWSRRIRDIRYLVDIFDMLLWNFFSYSATDMKSRIQLALAESDPSCYNYPLLQIT